MWEGAKPLDKLLEQGRKEGKTYMDIMRGLECMDRKMAAYGDWTLYRDADGNLWEEYFSIGD